MSRFEEVQMVMAEAIKEHFEIFNMQVFTEQFTLDRECKFHITLPSAQQPFTMTATVSVSYDVFQTGMSLYEDEIHDDENDIPYDDIDRSVDMEIILALPILSGNPDILAVINEVELEFPDAEPVLTVKETLNTDEIVKEYEVFIYYDIPSDELLDSDFYSEIFNELHEIMNLIYQRIKPYINHTWYKE